MTIVDWQKVCLNLRSSYKPLYPLGKEAGSDGVHLTRLARSEVSQPKFDVGVKLLDLHYDHCKDRHSEVFREAP